MRSPVPTKPTPCFKSSEPQPSLHHERALISVLTWALFSLFFCSETNIWNIIWNTFPSSKNDSHLNSFYPASFIFWLLCIWPRVCVQLWCFSQPCAQGLSVNCHGGLCKKKWNQGRSVGEAGSHMQREGSLFLRTWPCGPQACTVPKTKVFDWLWNCPVILAHWISWHFQHHGTKQVHGLRPMPLAFFLRSVFATDS